jgi:hypothetical protein
MMERHDQPGTNGSGAPLIWEDETLLVKQLLGSDQRNSLKTKYLSFKNDRYRSLDAAF